MPTYIEDDDMSECVECSTGLMRITESNRIGMEICSITLLATRAAISLYAFDCNCCTRIDMMHFHFNYKHHM